MARVFLIVCLMLGASFASVAGGPDGADSGQHKFAYRQYQGLPYRIWEPPVTKGERLPLVIFLHGAGERGNDNVLQLTHGADWLWQFTRQQKAVLLFPQAPSNDYWARVSVQRDTLPYRFTYPYEGNGIEPTNALSQVMGLVDELVAQAYIDRRRVYLVGLSMGGMGTLELLARKPDVFAAAIAICGGANPALVEHYHPQLAIQLFHGVDDQIVLAEYSKRMYDAMQAKGIDSQLTLYEGVGHGSWHRVFSDTSALEWLFSQSLPDADKSAQ